MHISGAHTTHDEVAVTVCRVIARKVLISGRYTRGHRLGSAHGLLLGDHAWTPHEQGSEPPGPELF